MSSQGYDDTDMTIEEFDQTALEGEPADVSNIAGPVRAAVTATVLVFEPNAPIPHAGRAWGGNWRLGRAPVVQSPRISTAERAGVA